MLVWTILGLVLKVTGFVQMANALKDAPDITSMWGIGDWQGYAEQLEDELKGCKRPRRHLVSGIGGVSLMVMASVVAEFLAR